MTVWELILGFCAFRCKTTKNFKTYKKDWAKTGEKNKEKVSCDSELVLNFLGNRKKQLLACEFSSRPKSGSRVKRWPQGQAPALTVGLRLTFCLCLKLVTDLLKLVTAEMNYSC